MGKLKSFLLLLNSNFRVNRQQHDADHLFVFSNPHIYNAESPAFFLRTEILHGLVNAQEQLTVIGLFSACNQLELPPFRCLLQYPCQNPTNAFLKRPSTKQITVVITDKIIKYILQTL